MVNTIKYLNLVLGYKGNKYRGYKWILAIFKLKGLVKIRVKRQRKKGQCEIVHKAQSVGLIYGLLARQKASHRRPDIGTLLSLQRGSLSGFLLDRVFPIKNISLRGPIRGTGTGGKLNLLLLIFQYLQLVKKKYRSRKI